MKLLEMHTKVSLLLLATYFTLSNDKGDHRK